ncbi:hypothetical protein GCM10010193_16650 [Kitasatospora atroaurantiaca]|uniref:Uncharacterized protein n=1 Tax=Kitasatospora atroaurantiaca TaxID=285545 RepID=A0A561EXD6_9ACTN|nr:hypothetical protein [Kitasatospora atroaurantiaca]TWE20276.1 hypothetical protein FB465_5424 [Kitasatospora atroaurantiaca]
MTYRHNGGIGGWGWFGMSLGMLLFTALLVAGGVLLFRALDRPQRPAGFADRSRPIDVRERTLSDEAGQTRARIGELTAHLHELDEETDKMRITRNTLLGLPTDRPSPKQPRIPSHRTIRSAIRSWPSSPIPAGQCGPGACARR